MLDRMVLGSTLFDRAAGEPRFSMDLPNQSLWRDDSPVKVPPKVFRLLTYLRDQPGRILESDELLDAVWPRELVQPEIIKAYIRTIRRLLGDDPKAPRFIETRVGCGYRFIGHLPDRCDVGGQSPKGPACLIGREGALASLQAACSAAAASHRRVVFVVGESGIGKTRMIDEFHARVRDDGWHVCRVDCAPARHAPTGFSLAGALAVSLEGFGDGPESVPPGGGHALCVQLEAIARAKPLILVVENLQWADQATFEAISRIACGREALPLLLVASYRESMRNCPSCPARTLMLDLVVHGAASELRLRALGTVDVRQLLLTSSPVALPTGAVEAIERCAGGNPLIITALTERMVAEVRESGTSELVSMLARREHEGEFLPEAVPQVIRHALELHLSELSRLARSVLECGSNGGFWFSAWCVSKVLGVDQEEVEETCRALCGSDLFLRESDPYVFPNGGVTSVYRFRSRLEARLLLAGQSHARRDFVQQRFAEAVEKSWGDEVGSVAARLAERFERARQWPRALHYARLAVANAAHTSRQDAALLLQRGLRLSERLPQERRKSEKDFFLRQLSQFS